ncbi:ABC transporter substrate-binding protein [Leptolyngbya sp. 7M]|uniref:ABC transporter substrate-binding protein n=1 Tax=Leptolyngbya sp. 7M TaxID=2812896 RepID=UPI001B8B3A75|nr:ABC transporter substrate-binding protein [Leptolyngbya sp. 7M]QYO64781.1 ABC transporter substrate-binding protein [Leptolyngbya sp. 7M]
MHWEKILTALKQRVDHCSQTTQSLPADQRPTVACIEWVNPLMGAGNWIPELVTMAGGTPLFGKVGQHSAWLQWSDLIEADPDILVIMPLGFGLERTRQDVTELAQHPDWTKLKAVQTGRVYITDGNHYFNRPGPRLVDSLEILAELLHPNLFQFGYRAKGWDVAADTSTNA